MRDVASWLTGYVTGYWQGFDFALNPTHDPDIEMELRREASSGSATGAADAPTAASPPDPGSLPLRGPLPGSRGSAASSLPAIRQLALPDDIEVAGQLEALYIHRGMAQALATMVEVFRGQDMPVAASICQRAFTAQALVFDDLEDRR